MTGSQAIPAEYPDGYAAVAVVNIQASIAAHDALRLPRLVAGDGTLRDLSVLDGRVPFTADEHRLLTILADHVLLLEQDELAAMLKAFVNHTNWESEPPTAAQIIRFVRYVVMIREAYYEIENALEGSQGVSWPSGAPMPNFAQVEGAPWLRP